MSHNSEFMEETVGEELVYNTIKVGNAWIGEI